MSAAQNSPSRTFWSTALAVATSVFIFVIAWIVGGILFNMFDNFRGLGDSKLQAVFRELVVPIIGGYLAVSLSASWFGAANGRFLFFGFAAILLR